MRQRRCEITDITFGISSSVKIGPFKCHRVELTGSMGVFPFVMMRQYVSVLHLLCKYAV